MRDMYIGGFLGALMTSGVVWVAVHRGDPWWQYVPAMLITQGASAAMWTFREWRRRHR